jgi:hypothetical protein
MMKDPPESRLLLAFAPAHKRALGIAVGTATGLTVLLLTFLSLLVDPKGQGNLGLLGEFFFGYTVSWTGAFIGGAWAFFVGFVAGWFTAFARNVGIAIWLFTVRTRAELKATRDFLDHI